MKPNVTERERALSLLEEQLPQLSKLFKECYLSKGRGSIVLYPFMLGKNHEIGEIAYSTKSESLDFFDNASSRAELRKLIANYNPTNEGILLLIVESGAAWFVTVKLHPPSEKGS